MNKKNICDIIIENITKQWENSYMTNGIHDEMLIPPLYSKSQIIKAGKAIIKDDIAKIDKVRNLNILNNWRAAHAYPLDYVVNLLRQMNPNAIVIQRLKRLESIINKLQRIQSMDLYHMQDLGGCRVIVNSIEEVYEIVNIFKEFGSVGIFVRENDYIHNPKASGYRSYHMVYKFDSSFEPDYDKKILIEIQFRTKLQHEWATAVEIMSIYSKSQLKSGIGDENILRFFTLISSLFAIIEDTPICPNTSNEISILINEIKHLDKQNNFLYKLSLLSSTIKITTDDNESIDKDGYYLLRLIYKERLLNINFFNKDKFELATGSYNALELLNNPDLDIVLVSATSFKELKEAYPNYFVDINEFIKVLNDTIEFYN